MILPEVTHSSLAQSDLLPVISNWNVNISVSIQLCKLHRNVVLETEDFVRKGA